MGGDVTRVRMVVAGSGCVCRVPGIEAAASGSSLRNPWGWGFDSAEGSSAVIVTNSGLSALPFSDLQSEETTAVILFLLYEKANRGHLPFSIFFWQLEYVLGGWKCPLLSAVSPSLSCHSLTVCPSVRHASGQ